MIALKTHREFFGSVAHGGAVVMMLIATLTASLVTNSGRSAWFVGVLVLMVYLIFALTLYLLPPGAR
jgi:Ca2+/H+ antiporter